MSGPVALGPVDEPVAEPQPREETKPDTFSESRAYHDPDPPIDVAEQEAGKPLITDLLEIDHNYAYDVWDDKEELDAIDNFIKEEIDTLHYKPSVTSYEKVFTSLKTHLGIPDEATKENVVERVTGFIKAFDKVRVSKEKTARRQVLNELYEAAYGQDFNAEDLELIIHENQLKRQHLWQ